MKMLPKKELVHVAGMLVVLAVGVRCAEPDAEEHLHAEFTDEGGLLVSDRESLQICLEVDDSLAKHADAFAARIEEAIASLRDHPDWAKTRFGEEPVPIEHGCPEATLPEHPLSAKDSIVGPGLGDHPSPYRTQIRVLADDRADAVLGEREAERAIAELMKVGDHTVAEVSSALVMRASALEGSALRERWLPIGLGLAPLATVETIEEAESLPKRTAEKVDK